MNCPNCGQPLNGSETQCPRCGIALQPASAQSPWGTQQASTPYPPQGYPPSQGYPPPNQAGAYPPPEAYPQAPGYPPTGQPPAYPPPGYPPAGYPPTGQPPAYPQYPPSQEYPQQPPPGWTGQPTGQPAPWLGQPTAQPWGMPPTPTPPPSTGGRNLLLGIIGAVIVVALIVGGVLFVQHSQSTSTSSTGGTNGATATPSQHVAFQDALTSDANQWNVDSTCFFSGGGYHINGSEACFNSGGSYGDASISVDVKQTSGDTSSAHGIVLRRGSAGNFYGFEIDAANDWAFYKYTSDQSTEIQSPSSNSAIKSGLNVTNTLKITASGSHFTFFVNGTQVGQADDTGYASGRSGLDGQDGSEVVYNNFKVTTP